MDSRPTFPTELIDLIIDKSWEIANDPDRAQSLSNLALLSHSSWDRVNKLRFHTVDFHGTFGRSVHSRIHAFRDLIESDPQPGNSALASYVRSFRLQLCAQMIPRKYPILEAGFLYDGTLSSVIKKLFKTLSTQGDTCTEILPSDQCSLTLKLTYKETTGDYDHSVSWLSLPTDLHSALFQCLQNPSLSTLHISHISHFPLDFFQNSFIRHFTINMTSISFKNIANSFVQEQIDFLKSLLVGPMFSFSTLTDLEPRKDAALANLTHLSTFIVSPHQMMSVEDLIFQSPYLEVLTIEYRSLNGRSNGSLAMQRSLHLRELNIHYDRANKSFKDTNDYALRHMQDTLNRHSLPPNLKCLKLTFSLYDDANWTHPQQALAAVDFVALDKFFSDPSFHSLSSLAFAFKFSMINPSQERFDMEQFLTRAKAWVRQQKLFPLITAREDKLQPDIIICPQIVQRSWRRPGEWYLL